MFRNWELPNKIQNQYASPISEERQYSNCNNPIMKKGAKINFSYSWDVDRLNNCGLDVHNRSGNGAYYQGMLCDQKPKPQTGMTQDDIFSAEDWEKYQDSINKNNRSIPDNPSCCNETGMYTNYRGRCVDYKNYMNRYNPVDGI